MSWWRRKKLPEPTWRVRDGAVFVDTPPVPDAWDPPSAALVLEQPQTPKVRVYRDDDREDGKVSAAAIVFGYSWVAHCRACTWLRSAVTHDEAIHLADEHAHTHKHAETP